MIEPELKLVSAVLRRWYLVLLAALAGVGIGAFVDYRGTPSYSTATELFIRFGNEYTVPATVTSSDRQQVDVDFDVAMNGEVQILTSLPVIEDALEAVPNPAYGTNALFALQSMSASHVANSPVLRLTVTDGDPAWARTFSERLIAEYRTRRDQLFRRNSNSEFIDARIGELAEELETTSVAIQDLRQQVRVIGTGSAPDPISGTASSEVSATETVAERIDRVQREIRLLEMQERTLAGLLEDMRSQDAKLDLLAASMGHVQVLQPPRTEPQPVGPGRLELMVLFGVAFGLLVAAAVLLIEASRGRRR